MERGAALCWRVDVACPPALRFPRGAWSVLIVFVARSSTASPALPQISAPFQPSFFASLRSFRLSPPPSLSFRAPVCPRRPSLALPAPGLLCSHLRPAERPFASSRASPCPCPCLRSLRAAWPPWWWGRCRPFLPRREAPGAVRSRWPCPPPVRRAMRRPAALRSRRCPRAGCPR